MRTYEEAMAAARPRRPFANGTEGYGWMDNWCDRCVHDKGTRDGTDERGCPLVMVALMEKTPVEWIDGPRDEQGRYSIADQYHCTEFRDEDEGGDDDAPPGPPAPEIEGQVDMFSVFADQITEQATREQVSA